MKRPDSRRAARRRACWARATLDGEEFLGVYGLVDAHEIVPEMGDLIDVFEPDDGEGGGGEAVFAGILGGADLAFWGTRSGRFGGIGAIGGDLFR